MHSAKRALEAADKLPRFRYRHLTIRHRLGMFVPQVLIKIAPRPLVVKAVEHPRWPNRVVKLIWVRVANIRSEQMCLRRDKLRWHIRNYAKTQRAKKYPTCIMVRGVPVLWDGNHRVTTARLLGKKHIRCACHFLK